MKLLYSVVLRRPACSSIQVANDFGCKIGEQSVHELWDEVAFFVSQASIDDGTFIVADFTEEQWREVARCDNAAGRPNHA